MQIAQDAASVVFASPIRIELGMHAPVVHVLGGADVLKLSCGKLILSSGTGASAACGEDYHRYQLSVRGCSAHLQGREQTGAVSHLVRACDGGPVEASGVLELRRSRADTALPALKCSTSCESLSVHLNPVLLDRLTTVLSVAAEAWACPEESVADASPVATVPDGGSAFDPLDASVAQLSVSICDLRDADLPERAAPAPVMTTAIRLEIVTLRVIVEETAVPFDVDVTGAALNWDSTADADDFQVEVGSLVCKPHAGEPFLVVSPCEAELAHVRVPRRVGEAVNVELHVGAVAAVVGGALAGAVEMVWDLTHEPNLSPPPTPLPPGSSGDSIAVVSANIRSLTASVLDCDDELRLSVGTDRAVSFLLDIGTTYTFFRLHAPGVSLTEVSSDGPLLSCGHPDSAIDITMDTRPPKDVQQRPEEGTGMSFSSWLDVSIKMPSARVFMAQLMELITMLMDADSPVWRLLCLSSRGVPPAAYDMSLGLQWNLRLVEAALVLPVATADDSEVLDVTAGSVVLSNGASPSETGFDRVLGLRLEQVEGKGRELAQCVLASPVISLTTLTPTVPTERYDVQVVAGAADGPMRVDVDAVGYAALLRTVSRNLLRQRPGSPQAPAPAPAEPPPPMYVTVSAPELLLHGYGPADPLRVSASGLALRVRWEGGRQAMDFGAGALSIVSPTGRELLRCRGSDQKDGIGVAVSYSPDWAATYRITGHHCQLSSVPAEWYEVQDFLYSADSISAAGTLLGPPHPPPGQGPPGPPKRVQIAVDALSLLFHTAALRPLAKLTLSGTEVDFDISAGGVEKVAVLTAAACDAEDLAADGSAPHRTVLRTDPGDGPAFRLEYRGGGELPAQITQAMPRQVRKAGVRCAAIVQLSLQRMRMTYRHSLWWNVLQSMTWGPVQNLSSLGYLRSHREYYSGKWDPRNTTGVRLEWRDPVLVLPATADNADAAVVRMRTLELRNQCAPVERTGRVRDVMTVVFDGVAAEAHLSGMTVPLLDRTVAPITIVNHRGLVLRDGHPYDSNLSLTFPDTVDVHVCAQSLALLRRLWGKNLSLWPDPYESGPPPFVGDPGTAEASVTLPLLRADVQRSAWEQRPWLSAAITGVRTGYQYDKVPGGASTSFTEVREVVVDSDSGTCVLAMSAGPDGMAYGHASASGAGKQSGSRTVVGAIDLCVTPQLVGDCAVFGSGMGGESGADQTSGAADEASSADRWSVSGAGQVGDAAAAAISVALACVLVAAPPGAAPAVLKSVSVATVAGLSVSVTDAAGPLVRAAVASVSVEDSTEGERRKLSVSAGGLLVTDLRSGAETVLEAEAGQPLTGRLSEGSDDGSGFSRSVSAAVGSLYVLIRRAFVDRLMSAFATVAAALPSSPPDAPAAPAQPVGIDASLDGVVAVLPEDAEQPHGRSGAERPPGLVVRLGRIGVQSRLHDDGDGDARELLTVSLADLAACSSDVGSRLLHAERGDAQFLLVSVLRAPRAQAAAAAVPTGVDSDGQLRGPLVGNPIDVSVHAAQLRLQVQDESLRQLAKVIEAASPPSAGGVAETPRVGRPLRPGEWHDEQPAAIQPMTLSLQCAGLAAAIEVPLGMARAPATYEAAVRGVQAEVDRSVVSAQLRLKVRSVSMWQRDRRGPPKHMIETPDGSSSCIDCWAIIRDGARSGRVSLTGPTFTFAVGAWTQLGAFLAGPLTRTAAPTRAASTLTITRDLQLAHDLDLHPANRLRVARVAPHGCVCNRVTLDGNGRTLALHRPEDSRAALITVADDVVLVIKNCYLLLDEGTELREYVRYEGLGSGLVLDSRVENRAHDRRPALCLSESGSASGEALGAVTELTVRCAVGVRLTDPAGGSAPLVAAATGELSLSRESEQSTATLSVEHLAVRREGTPEVVLDSTSLLVSVTSDAAKTEVSAVMNDVAAHLRYSDAVLLSKVLREARVSAARGSQDETAAGPQHTGVDVEATMAPRRELRGVCCEANVKCRSITATLVDDAGLLSLPLLSLRLADITAGSYRRRSRSDTTHHARAVVSVGYHDSVNGWAALLVPREVLVKVAQGADLSTRANVTLVLEARLCPAFFKVARRCGELAGILSSAFATGTADDGARPPTLRNTLCSAISCREPGESMFQRLPQLSSMQLDEQGVVCLRLGDDGEGLQVDTRKPCVQHLDPPSAGVIVEVRGEGSNVIVEVRGPIQVHNDLPCGVELGGAACVLPANGVCAVPMEALSEPLSVRPHSAGGEWSAAVAYDEASGTADSVPLPTPSEIAADAGFSVNVRCTRKGVHRYFIVEATHKDGVQSGPAGIRLRPCLTVTNLSGCPMRIGISGVGGRAEVPSRAVADDGSVADMVQAPGQRVALHMVLEQPNGDVYKTPRDLPLHVRSGRHSDVGWTEALLTSNKSQQIWVGVSRGADGTSFELTCSYWVINHTSVEFTMVPVTGPRERPEEHRMSVVSAKSATPTALGPTRREEKQRHAGQPDTTRFVRVRFVLQPAEGGGWDSSDAVPLQNLGAEGVLCFKRRQLLVGFTTGFANGAQGFRTRVLQLYPRWVFVNRTQGALRIATVAAPDDGVTLPVMQPVQYNTGHQTDGDAAMNSVVVKPSEGPSGTGVDCALPIDEVGERVFRVKVTQGGGSVFVRAVLTKAHQTIHVTLVDATAPYQIANRCEHYVQLLELRGDGRSAGVNICRAPPHVTVPFALTSFASSRVRVSVNGGGPGHGPRKLSRPIDLGMVTSEEVHIDGDLWVSLRPLHNTVEVNVYTDKSRPHVSGRQPALSPIDLQVQVLSTEVLVSGGAGEELVHITLGELAVHRRRAAQAGSDKITMTLQSMQIDDATPVDPRVFPVVLHASDTSDAPLLDVALDMHTLPSPSLLHLRRVTVRTGLACAWISDTLLCQTVRFADRVNESLDRAGIGSRSALEDSDYLKECTAAEQGAVRLQVDSLHLGPLDFVLNVRRNDAAEGHSDPYAERFGMGWLSGLIFSIRSYEVALPRCSEESTAYNSSGRLLSRIADHYFSQLRSNFLSIPGYIGGVLTNMFTDSSQHVGPVLRVGDVVTARKDHGLDAPQNATMAAWRLRRGEEATVVRIDADGDPFLRHAATGVVSSAAFHRTRLRLLRRPLLPLPPTTVCIDGFAASEAIENAVESLCARERRNVVRVRARGRSCLVTFNTPAAAARLLAQFPTSGQLAGRQLIFTYDVPAPLRPFEGLTGGDLSARLHADESGIAGVDVDQNCVVTDVTPDSAAERAGLRPGMQVVKVDGQPVDSREDVLKAAGAARDSGVHDCAVTFRPAGALIAEHPGVSYAGPIEDGPLICPTIEHARVEAARLLPHDTDLMACWSLSGGPSRVPCLVVRRGAAANNPVSSPMSGTTDPLCTMFFSRATLDAAPHQSAVRRRSPHRTAPLDSKSLKSVSSEEALLDHLSWPTSNPFRLAAAEPRMPSVGRLMTADSQSRFGFGPVPGYRGADDDGSAAGDAVDADRMSHPGSDRPASSMLPSGADVWLLLGGDWVRGAVTAVDRDARVYVVRTRNWCAGAAAQAGGGDDWCVSFADAARKLCRVDDECEERTDLDAREAACACAVL
eukprot:TRINITY_DN14285_c0_g5_i1.p1 TRINITY_DN14285_c0_g5~~TRINITY_DN14285_c0_g5_i1.p1  ORF type:complete len:4080 (+),score=1311.84 TRINITY_DN14285_c0_g5_i1:1571-12241(+)